jgi:hypothetical protein
MPFFLFAAAAVSTAVTAVTVGFASFAAAASYFLVTTAMGAALNALTPKPKIGAAGAQGFSLRGESGAALDHQIIYGETRVGGARIYDSATPTNSNKYLHRILAFAGHEIDSYVDIYLNDDVVTLSVDELRYEILKPNPLFPLLVTKYVLIVPSSFEYNIDDVLTDEQLQELRDNAVYEETSSQAQSILNPVSEITVTKKEISSGEVISPSQYVGHVRIKTYLGTTTQTADPDLVSETANLDPTEGRWTSEHRLQGIAYIYVRFEYDQDAFPNGVPAVSAKIRGKKVFDPSTSTTAWSDNAALCLRDYLTSDYGLDQPSSRIDDTLVDAAADICDQTVESEKRYTCNGAFTTGLEPSVIVSNLLSSMGGLLWYGQGKWRMKAAAWTTPTVSFDENDLRSGISLSTRHSRRDNFNSVKGTFAGDITDWQVTDYPQVPPPSDTTFLDIDGGLVNVLDLPLPFTSSDKTAQRIARIALNRNREQLTFSASFSIRAFQVQVGDFVNINNSRFGWDNKPFEIVEWTFGLQDNLEILVNMTLREISEGVFTGVNGQAFELNNTTLPNAFTAPIVSIPTNTILSTTRLIRENVTEVFSFEVTAQRPQDVSYVEVQFKEVRDSFWRTLGLGQLEIYELVDPELGQYQFRARGVSPVGVKGPWAFSAIVETANSRFPPQDVFDFSYEINGTTVNLDWEPIKNLDLSYYKIRHAVETTNATWANATTAVEKIPRPATNVSLSGRSGTYLIRAYDKTGVASKNATNVVITANEAPSFATTLTQSEHTAFSGTKLNCEVESSELVISPDLAFEASSADNTNVRTYPLASNFLESYESCRDIFVRNDGTSVYFVTGIRPYVVQFDLQIPYELSSIIPRSEKILKLPRPTGQPHNSLGIYITQDGETLYWTSTRGGVANVYEYTMSIPWDITTATDSGNSFEVTSQFRIITGITFKPDGTEMYLSGNDRDIVAGTGGDHVSQYTLSTAWDITTASFTDRFDVNSQLTSFTTLTSVLLNPDGSRMFITSSSPTRVWGYSLATNWDVSSASYTTNDFVEFEEDLVLTGMTFDDTGGKLMLSSDTFDDRRFAETTVGQRAIYEFSNYIETSDNTARKVRARVDAAVSRLSRADGTFDSVFGLFDYLDGLFDDLGDTDQSGDTNILFYISTTEDDPAGTPTWSEYKKFRCGEFYGRAFRFKIVLTSQSPTLTPSIETLTAVVEYD